MAELLRANGLTKSYDAIEIFHDVSFVINGGQPVGLVGANGAGKTTLLRILAGRDTPDNGQIVYPHPLRVAYLPQEPQFDEAVTITANALALASAGAVAGGQATGRGAAPTDLPRARRVLRGLGFSAEQQDAVAAGLSGGEKTRLGLAGLLLSDADLLLLDEPTNHLDTDALEWLERFIRGTKATVVVVSHDRYFLDQVAGSILAIEHGKLTQYTGNYSAYVQAREAARRRQMAEYEEYQGERRRLRDIIKQQMDWYKRAVAQTSAKYLEDPKTKAFYRARAAKLARRGQAKRSALERLEAKPVERLKDRRQVNLGFATPSRAGDEILRVESLTKGFGDRTLFRDASFTIRHGERAAIVGPNGSGKTTFLRIALGLVASDQGKAVFGPSVRPGYLAQQLEQLDPDTTVIGTLQAVAPALHYGELRTLLGCFLFGDNEINRPVATLSTGEKVRLAIATLIAGGCNCLVLDEPTNHLDLPTRERVEEALADYSGALILVSHDRYLLRRLATRTLAIEGDRVRDYPGGYDYYIAKRRGGNPGGEEDVLLLENRLSVLAGELGRTDARRRGKAGGDEAGERERVELEREFIAVSRQLAERRQK